MENSGNFINAIGFIVFWWFIFYIFYRDYKRRKLEEDAKKSMIKIAKEIEKIANCQNNISPHDLSARIDRLEKVIEEKLWK